MNNNNKDSEKSRFFVVGFVVLIVLSIAVCIYAAKVIKDGSDKKKDVTEQPQTQVSETQITSDDSMAETEVTVQKHISPVKTLFSSFGIEKPEINKILDKDTDKTINVPIKDFACNDEQINSFVFIVYSEDGTSSMGALKGGFGISVTQDCPLATSKNWYQPDDFSIDTNGAYYEVRWDIPQDIINYIDYDGEVMFGYWWSDVQKIRLSSIVCNKTCLKDIPVDGERSISVNQQLNYESSQKMNIPLNKLLGDKDTPRCFEISVSSSDNLGKLTFALGMSQKDSDELKLDNIVVFTDTNSAKIDWILPDNSSQPADYDGTLNFYYWWSNCKDITITDVKVYYSNDGSSGNYTPDAAAETEAQDNASADQGGSTDSVCAADIVKSINVGWNLGNSLDVYDADSETGWGNVKTTKEMIDTVRNAGFNTIRIPVTWYEHLNSGKIDPAWLDRVEEIVNFALDNKMYVIINVHHDDMVWLNPTYSEKEADTKTFAVIWTQIAERFNKYDGHLSFEGLNEPRVVGSAEEWNGGNAEQRDVINSYLQTFVDTVRATGGNNKDRCLIVTTHAASITDAALNGLVLPDDDNLILSVHSYSPWNFAGSDEQCTDTDWGTQEDMNNLDSEFDRLYNKFVSKGIPVIIGEFGADFKNNDSDRAKYYEYYISAAKKRNIKCIVWDNGNKEEFGLLNREKNKWFNDSIITAIMNGAK